MKNKYKEELSKYKVLNKVKERIYTKIEQPQIKRFKLSYGIIAIILTCIISVGIVYADDIKEYIIRHSSATYKVKFQDGTILTSKGDMKLFKTKLDDYRLTEEDYENTLPEMPLKELEDKVGLEFLSFNGNKNYKTELGFDSIADKNDPETYGMIYGINVIYDAYVVDHNTNSKNVDARLAVMSSHISTVNYLKIYPEEEKEEHIEEYETGENYLGEVYIENLGIKGYLTDVPRIKKDEDIEYYLNFTYKDITYQIWSINLTKEELLEIANNLK